MVRPSPLRPDLDAARAQGWQITVIDKHTLRLTHPQAGELVVDDTKSGEHTRKALRQAMAAIRSYEAQSKSYETQDGHR